MLSLRSRRAALVLVVARSRSDRRRRLDLGDRARRCRAGDWPALRPHRRQQPPLAADQITPANVGAARPRLHHRLPARSTRTSRRGQQSYPLAIDGTLYVTTNDDNVFAIDGATGKVIWQLQADEQRGSSRTSASSPTAASPTAAASSSCSSSTCSSSRSAERRAGRRAASRSAQAVPERVGRTTATRRRARRSARTASSIIGAAGSEYGVRGFVMAYTTDLTPAWPNPFWTIPPERQSWRRASPDRRRRRRLDARHDRRDARTRVYFGTGSATPRLLPDAPARARTRAPTR